MDVNPHVRISFCLSLELVENIVNCRWLLKQY